MYVMTNRKIWHRRAGLSIFGHSSNVQGSNELRLVRVHEDDSTEVLDNELSKSEASNLIDNHSLRLNPEDKQYASLRVACEVFQQAMKLRRHLLVFVHGYNNDMRDVIDTARALEKLYNVIVVPFSWPANGGGPVTGTAAYLSDKVDARASATALHRAVDKVGEYHRLLTEGLQERLWAKATKENSKNYENARALFAQSLEENCNITLNLMCHSMGNYVLKHATVSSESATRRLVFDNVCLVAADVNNPGHDSWVENIPSRNRLYIVMNENDWALKWSRIKPGDEQKERLGHHLRNLNAKNAYYIDLTRSRNVESEHSYFKGKAAHNPIIKRIFSAMFRGSVVERGLVYDAHLNVYRPSE